MQPVLNTLAKATQKRALELLAADAECVAVLHEWLKDLLALRTGEQVGSVCACGCVGAGGLCVCFAGPCQRVRKCAPWRARAWWAFLLAA